MSRKLIKWAAVAVLSVGVVAPALGGSVTRPGDTIGLAVGVPLPEGVYLGNNTTQECRNTSPQTTCYLVDTPILVWSTPWTIFGARVQPAFGPVVPIKFNSGANGISGLFNSFGAVQLIWDLGHNWGFSYMLGGYTNNLSNPVAISSGSLNQRFGLTYSGDGWNLTANVIWGVNFELVTSNPELSPCPFSPTYPHNGCNPNFLNVDLTATKRFGRWELGPVGLYSTDLNAPIPTYQEQSQFGLGGLVGYYFDRVSVQAYVTSDVYEKNYGGSRNISGNLRATFPLWNPSAPATRSIAAANDAPAKLYTKAPPPPPPFSWTGFYVGANIGGAWARNGWSEPPFLRNFYNTSGLFIGGGQMGGNYQIGKFVIGGEWDFDWAGNHNPQVLVPGFGTIAAAAALASLPFAPAPTPPPPGIPLTGINHWITTVAARFGYAIDNWLLYGKAGGGWAANNNWTITDVTTGMSLTCSIFSRDCGKYTGGLLLGAGYEWAFTKNWTVRMEYDYLGLGNRIFVIPATAPLLAGATAVTNDRNVQMLKVGVNYLFNWGAGVTERY